MDVAILTEYFTQYGFLTIFIIVFLEYLNLPGFPAGIIMPLAGIWTAGSGGQFFIALIVSVLAGLAGSLMLYLLGYFGGDFMIKKYQKLFPKQKDKMEQILERIRTKGCSGIFVSKLIPMIRTIISIPAGAVRMNVWGYTIYSCLGIFVWNLVFMGAGYLIGEPIFNLIG